MLPGYFITLSLARGCGQVLVTKCHKEILTGRLAWADGDSDAAGLWIWLQDYGDGRCSQRLISGDTRLGPEPPCPWLAPPPGLRSRGSRDSRLPHRWFMSGT
jgi:hypothetical protein